MIDGKCSARRHSDGKPCQRPAVRGATVCAAHGGNAPQIKNAAHKRLDQAADVLVQRLLNFALDSDTSDNVALQAVIAALDRADIIKPAQLDVTVGTPKAWEVVFDSIAGGSREESRARRGATDAANPPLALDTSQSDDVEVIPAEAVIDAYPLEDIQPERVPRPQPPVQQTTGEAALGAAAELTRKRLAIKLRRSY